MAGDGDIVGRLSLIARQCRQMDKQAGFGGDSVGVRVKDSAFLVEAAEEAAAEIARLRTERDEAVAREREAIAVLCDTYAEINMETCGDNIILDPLLHGEPWTTENVKKSEDMQINSVIHSSYYHAATHLAAAIRARRDEER